MVQKLMRLHSTRSCAALYSRGMSINGGLTLWSAWLNPDTSLPLRTSLSQSNPTPNAEAQRRTENAEEALIDDRVGIFTPIGHLMIGAYPRPHVSSRDFLCVLVFFSAPLRWVLPWVMNRRPRQPARGLAGSSVRSIARLRPRAVPCWNR